MSILDYGTRQTCVEKENIGRIADAVHVSGDIQRRVMEWRWTKHRKTLQYAQGFAWSLHSVEIVCEFDLIWKSSDSSRSSTRSIVSWILMTSTCTEDYRWKRNLTERLRFATRTIQTLWLTCFWERELKRRYYSEISSWKRNTSKEENHLETYNSDNWLIVAGVAEFYSVWLSAIMCDVFGINPSAKKRVAESELSWEVLRSSRGTCQIKEKRKFVHRKGLYFTTVNVSAESSTGNDEHVLMVENVQLSQEDDISSVTVTSNERQEHGSVGSSFKGLKEECRLFSFLLGTRFEKWSWN